MNNNTTEQDISNLSIEELKKVLESIAQTIGAMELDKQIHIHNYALVAALLQ